MTRLSKTTLYRLVSSTVSNCLVLTSRVMVVMIVDRNGTWFVGWIGDFVDDVLFEDFKIQLFLPAGVEGKPAYFAFDFPIFGSVSVILGASGSKLDDVVTGF